MVGLAQETPESALPTRAVPSTLHRVAMARPHPMCRMERARPDRGELEGPVRWLAPAVRADRAARPDLRPAVRQDRWLMARPDRRRAARRAQTWEDRRAQIRPGLPDHSRRVPAGRRQVG